MNLTLYLDDDFFSDLRVLLLRQAGFDVVFPAEVGTTGSPDAQHLRRSTELGRVLVSHNVADFHRLHGEVLAANGHHSGILLVHQQPPVSAAEIVRRFVAFDARFAGQTARDALLFPPMHG